MNYRLIAETVTELLLVASTLRFPYKVVVEIHPVKGQKEPTRIETAVIYRSRADAHAATMVELAEQLMGLIPEGECTPKT